MEDMALIKAHVFFCAEIREEVFVMVFYVTMKSA